MRLHPVISPYILTAAAIAAVVLAFIMFARDRRPMLVRILTLLQIICITILALIIGLRPQRRQIGANVQLKNLDVLFVLDTTISMWAEDYNGKHPRMGGALSDIRYIVNELDGSNFGLITFDNRSSIIAPYTQDTKAILSDLFTINMPDHLVAEGTGMSTPIRDMESLLVSSDRKENRRTVLFILTDGEITNGEEMPDYSSLSSLVDSGAVLGYGTENGGRMTTSYGSRLIDPETYDDAVSMIDEDNLKKMAEDLGIDYIHMDRQDRLSGILNRIKSESILISEEKNGIELYDDLYQYYTYPLLVLIALTIILFVLRQRQEVM